MAVEVKVEALWRCSFGAQRTLRTHKGHCDLKAMTHVNEGHYPHANVHTNLVTLKRKRRGPLCLRGVLRAPKLPQ